jgi:phage terminase large subunit GpA-like protein
MSAISLTLTAARRAIRPKAPLTVSEWSDANRVLSGEGSAEAGAWKTSRTPYLREIMDALSEESPVRKVVFMLSLIHI